ncbi:MAG: PHP domain-containing protein [Methanomicrobiales archaeon]|nr:PHP domain-containing protein [Methanomicrobiales archaeon]
MNRGKARVWFDRPAPDELAALGYRAVDMHFHTNYSDSHTTVRAAVGLARKKRIGVAITDHNHIGGVLEAERIAGEETWIVPGIEVSTSDGPHILLFFYASDELEEFYRQVLEDKKGPSPFMATMLSTMDLLEATDNFNCIRAAAHPYGYLVLNRGVAKCVEKEYLDKEVFSRIEVIEVICGGMTRLNNAKAVKLALMYNRGMIGGSDGHLLRDLGGVLTCATSESIEDLLDDIVHDRGFVVGMERNMVDNSVMSMMALTKHLRYTVPSLATHYRQNAPRVRRFVEDRIHPVQEIAGNNVTDSD